MEQASAKLRKTFRYPEDNDISDSIPDALDEEEQDRFIQSIREENHIRNTQYARVLIALPMISTVPYFTTLFTGTTALLSILSITSLFSTAYLLYILPPDTTSISFLDGMITTPPNKQSTSAGSYRQALVDDGPIAQFLPYLNLGLCGILIFLGKVVGMKQDIWWGFGWLPAAVYGIVLLSKWIMGSVDPEGELGGLKYGLKGA